MEITKKAKRNILIIIVLKDPKHWMKSLLKDVLFSHKLLLHLWAVIAGYVWSRAPPLLNAGVRSTSFGITFLFSKLYIPHLISYSVIGGGFANGLFLIWAGNILSDVFTRKYWESYIEFLLLDSIFPLTIFFSLTFSFAFEILNLFRRKS